MITLLCSRSAREVSSGKWVGFLTTLAVSSLTYDEARSEQSGFDLNYDALQLKQVSLPTTPIQVDMSKLTSDEVIRAFVPSFESSSTDHLKSLIASVEAASAGYDAVVHSAWVKPSALPTEMSLEQIYAWIHATPHQNHAIGRYQIIPSTLKRLVGKSGLPLKTRYSKTTQDFLADILLEEAGYASFLNGSMSQRQFMQRLARIWAGLPTPSGRSYYHGVAGNRAMISWKRFDQVMTAIFSGGAQGKQVSELLRF